MDDLLKSVRTVFSEAINNGKHFIVPSYQRGYKWNRENVFKLLDDLKSFVINPKVWILLDNSLSGIIRIYQIMNSLKKRCQKGVDGSQKIHYTVIIHLGFATVLRFSPHFEKWSPGP